MSLYLAYPDIPWRALSRAQSVTYSVQNNIGNTIHGERTILSTATAGSGGAITAEWDLGSAVTSTIDYLIIARAKDLKDQGTTTVTLDSTTTGIGGAYTNRYSDSTLQTTTLYGPDSNDYLATGLALSAFRGWRFGISGGADTARTLCKVYFGNAFDFGVQPASFSWTRQPRYTSTFMTASGAIDYQRLDTLVYRFSIHWVGLSDAIIKSFYDTIVRYSQRHRYFLYTTSNTHEVLNNLRVLHCSLQKVSTFSVKQNWNRLDCEFEQVAG